MPSPGCCCGSCVECAAGTAPRQVTAVVSGYNLRGFSGYNGTYLLANVPPPFFPLYATCCWNYLFEPSDYNPQGFVGIGFCPSITAGSIVWRVLFYKEGIFGQVWGYQYDGPPAAGQFPYPPQNCRILDNTTSTTHVFVNCGGTATVRFIY